MKLKHCHLSNNLVVSTLKATEAAGLHGQVGFGWPTLDEDRGQSQDHRSGLSGLEISGSSSLYNDSEMLLAPPLLPLWKVLACVVCGRLKSAFQIASRSGSVADVQYVAHQALHANALPVLDMCKQWLAQYM
ncbi:hypothetical protein CK203_005367 [Vitis vinifera]|uniref:ZFYVE26-like TPR repeats domain-containing protein n=1 Tax=Vitis vinifera TaxID=29760 RepID=A0A438KED1_VITVI|nr:hypothetical protein CK203_005367 [Vitis vinifera]